MSINRSTFRPLRDVITPMNLKGTQNPWGRNFLLDLKPYGQDRAQAGDMTECDVLLKSARSPVV